MTETTPWWSLLAATMTATLALVAVAPPASAALPDQADAVEVHERDVFVIVGSTCAARETFTRVVGGSVTL